jgi:hypothetical protein
MVEQSNSSQEREIPAIQKWIAVLWPSFLVAGIETIVFFTLFDPLHVFAEYEVSRTGAYSIGFFLFWGFSILPCFLTMYFAKPCKPCANYRDELKQNDE